MVTVAEHRSQIIFSVEGYLAEKPDTGDIKTISK
jgi:hypothetical protein